MQIDFCFSGWIRGFDIESVYEVETGLTVNIDNISADEVYANLKSGKWAISLKEALDNSSDAEVEVFDFEVRV